MTKFGKWMMAGVAAASLMAAVVPMRAQAPDGQQSGPQGPPPQGGPGGRRGGGPEQRLERMQKELNLTADQSAKVKTILEDGRAKMMAMREDTSSSQDDKRASMMKAMKAENEKILDVLNADQKTKFKAMEEKQRERMRDGGGRRGGPGGAPGGGSGSDAPPPPPPPAA